MNTYVVFDLDGTLADTMGVLTDLAVSVILRHYLVTEDFARERYLETIGRTFSEQLAEIFPADPVNDVAAAEFNRIKLDEWLARPPFRFAAPVCHELVSRGFTVFVASSTEREYVQRYISRYELPVLQAAGATKKEQLTVIRRLVSGPIVMVGDSPYDGRLASDCGLAFIGVCHTLPKDVFSRRGLVAVSNLAAVYTRLTERGD